MDFEFEAALSNSLQHFLHMSGLKHEQKVCMPGNFGTEAPCFRNSTDWFWGRVFIYFFNIATASTERLVETSMCLCLSNPVSSWFLLYAKGQRKHHEQPFVQGGKRPGGETGSPLLVQCVMWRSTGTSAPSTFLVRFMAAKNFLSTKRKSTFLSLFLSFLDATVPKYITFMSVVMMIK